VKKHKSNRSKHPILTRIKGKLPDRKRLDAHIKRLNQYRKVKSD